MNNKLTHKKNLKMSNVLLLVVLFAAGIFFSSFVISVNSKLKNGEYVYSNGDKSLFKRTKFGIRKTLALQNLTNCTIVLSDSVSFDVRNQDSGKFQYMSSPDSITIIQNEESGNNAFLYVPNDSRLVVNSGVVTIRGSLDYTQQASYDIILNNSKLTVSAGEVHTFFDRLKISGTGHSKLSSLAYVHIKDLELVNIKDVVLTQGWQIGKLSTVFEDGHMMIKRSDSVLIVPK